MLCYFSRIPPSFSMRAKLNLPMSRKLEFGRYSAFGTGAGLSRPHDLGYKAVCCVRKLTFIWPRFRLPPLLSSLTST